MTRGKFEAYYKKLPLEVQGALGSFSKLMDDNFWRGTRYDWMNIGTVESRQYLDQYAARNILDTYKRSGSIKCCYRRD